MRIIFNHNILGKLISQLDSDKEKETVIFTPPGSGNPKIPDPFLIGINTATKKLFPENDLYTGSPKASMFTLDRKGIFKESESIQLKYKRPGSFKRNNTAPVSFINPSIREFSTDPLSIEGNVMGISVKNNEDQVLGIQVNYSDEEGNFKTKTFETDKGATKIFITIPIKYISVKENFLGIIFAQDEEFNRNSRDFYHLYQADCLTTVDNIPFKEDILYSYIEDNYFKIPLLKRIVMLDYYNPNRSDPYIAFQFLSRKILDNKAVVDLINKIGQLMGDNFICVDRFRKIGIEFRRRDKILDKYQPVIAQKFNTKLLGRFCMQDHSRLHDNLLEADQFLKGGK